MIVVDTSMLAYLFLAGERTRQAEHVLETDSDWVAPLLWRSEFRNILATSGRTGRVDLEDALRIMDRAERLMAGSELSPNSASILALAAESGCTAYDCEFIAVARQLAIKLVTTDRQVLAAFPEDAVSPEGYLGETRLPERDEHRPFLG